MKTRLSVLLMIFFSVVSGLVVSCSEDGCENALQPMAQFMFKSAADTADVAMDTLSVVAEGTDSVLINRDIMPSSVALPLNKAAEQTRYTLLMTVNVRDTIPHYYVDEDGITQVKDSIVVTTYHISDAIEVYYRNTQRFTSLDCGIIFTHTIDSVKYTSNLISRIEIMNPLINSSDGQNFYIYF